MTEAEMAQALDRIARTTDGHELYRWLQIESMYVEPADVTDGALRTSHGRRSLARQLMAFMADGVESSVGDRAVVIHRGQPAGAQPIRGARDFRRALERDRAQHNGTEPA